jgi:hypothetical protein
MAILAKSGLKAAVSRRSTVSVQARRTVKPSAKSSDR